MTATAERIYEALKDETGYISVEELAHRLGLSSGRALRGKTDGNGNYEYGILRTAGDEIFREKGLALVRRMEDPPGVKLTADPEEVKGTGLQWLAFGAKIMEQGNDYVKKAALMGSLMLDL